MIIAPDYNDVRNAAERIKGHARKTPLVTSEILNEMTGANVFVKPECLQRTGSFKFRGAFNALSCLSKEQASKGVVACSSGNHAQGVAEAARILGIDATIVMPADAPATKVARTKRSGANVMTYDRQTEDRDKIVQKISAETGAELVHPFNDARVIAGQGTVGLEIVEQLEELGIASNLDRALICTGGGGLTSGVALSLKQQYPDISIHCVEPEGFDDYQRSVETGSIQSNKLKGGSVCDALLSEAPGDIGFSINKDMIESGLVVTDQDALDAVQFAFNELKLVVEPGGAVALAALIKAGKKWQGETIACVISGGNIDPEMMARALG